MNKRQKLSFKKIDWFAEIAHLFTVLLLVGGLGLFYSGSQAAKVYAQSSRPAVPAMSTPVVDQAGVLLSGAKTRLDALLHKLYQERGIQIGVLVVPSLEGTSLEEHAIAVASAWKLGNAKDDRGLLILLAPHDRKVRLEVGRGLEGDFTDLQSRRVIDNTMIPYFKSGDWGGGLMAGIADVLSQIAPDFLPESERRVSSKSSDKDSGKIPFGLLVILFVFIMAIVRGGGGGGGRRGRRHNVLDAMVLGGLLGGSRRGSSSWGGGSWGGGGGSFGGGGSSGSW